MKTYCYLLITCYDFDDLYTEQFVDWSEAKKQMLKEMKEYLKEYPYKYADQVNLNSDKNEYENRSGFLGWCEEGGYVGSHANWRIVPIVEMN